MKQEKKAADMSARELARYIDQSVLKPEFTQDDIRRYIQDGIDVGCATVCINPASLPIAQEMCSGTDTRICVVCDFPFGLSTTESKALQAREYCSKYDVFELDIVSNFGWIRSGLWDKVRDDIAAVCNVCHEYGVAVKTIFETDALTLPQILQATDVAIEAGTDFVKTSTGFYTGSVNYSPDGKCVGASTELIEAIIKRVNGRCKVKGSGAIRTREHFLSLIDMGIDRMGIGYKSLHAVLGIN